MDPETLKTIVRDLIGRDLSVEESTRICDAAGRMLAVGAPILAGNAGGLPHADFRSVLRELAKGNDGGGGG